ncbi:MAG: ATP-dependent helicase RhlE [Solirubrobacterales bacterium]|nr:ATP-dependent helicase RhlE [Solirubrobacterales bacterium]
MKSFADLGISRPVVDALSARGISAPFPIQEMVVSDTLDGHDLLVQSPTGSGKTLAFGIPMVDLIEPGDLAALVLAPTRELASQIVDELDSICRVKNLSITAVYGGVGFGPQIRAAKRADIVVATPGRLEDLLARGVISLNGIELLILDEADRMLDMGFKPAVARIVGQTPDDRQTLFFSATLEGATGDLAAAYTRNARRHTKRPAVDEKAEIEHSFVHVDSPSDKFEHLTAQLRDGERGRTLVFVRTKRGADRLVKRLRKSELEAVAMHGDKTQSQRERALARFERGDVDTLIATDVAARGIDVAGITHVINFDAPGDQDAYVHRIGRTGRAGERGTGISFVLGDQTKEMGRIARDLGLGAEFELGRGGTETTVAAAPRAEGGSGSRSGSPSPRKRRRRRSNRNRSKENV